MFVKVHSYEIDAFVHVPVIILFLFICFSLNEDSCEKWIYEKYPAMFIKTKIKRKQFWIRVLLILLRN